MQLSIELCHGWLTGFPGFRISPRSSSEARSVAEWWSRGGNLRNGAYRSVSSLDFCQNWFYDEVLLFRQRCRRRKKWKGHRKYSIHVRYAGGESQRSLNGPQLSRTFASWTRFISFSSCSLTTTQQLKFLKTFKTKVKNLAFWSKARRIRVANSR